jgi:hypothetical protein
MTTRPETWQRALAVLTSVNVDANQAAYLLNTLNQSGLNLVDDLQDELAVKWVDVRAQAVPPEADTIIRTITKTNGADTSSTTHWLDGLRGPRV